MTEESPSFKLGWKYAILAIIALFIASYKVPPNVEYQMIGEQWNVGTFRHGIELTATEKSGLFGSNNVAYFRVNGTTYTYTADSTVSIAGVKFSIEIVDAQSGYIRVKWR